MTNVDVRMPSRRRSSRSVHEEEPQPGSSTASPRKMSDEKVELLARLLSQIRAARDKREMEYVREFEETNPSASDVEMHEYILHQLSAVNEAILKLEQQLSGSLLEDMLKSTDNDDDDAPTSDTGPPDPTTTDAKPSAMEPIEIKVEDEHNASLTSMPSSDVPESQSMLSVTTSERDESNVERAIRQEHEVVARVAELRRNGKWPQSRLPLCAEPKRSKTHWDFLLEEVQWMAADFRQERIFKRNIARKLSTAIARQKREMDLKEEKREERELKEGRRICTFIAKMIREFWMNVDKIVDKKAQEILDAKKRQALDQHLTFIVSEADKLSSMVQEGLQQDRGSSATPSASSDKDKNDVDYEELSESESDDEETIAKAEKEQAGDVKEEMNALAEEGDMDMDAFLASLPPEYLASLGIQPAMAETKGAGRAARKEREGNMEEEADSDDEPVAESSQETETTMEDAKEEEEEVNTEGESDPKRRRTESPEDREEKEDKTDMKIKEGEGLGDGRGMLDSVDYAKLNSENSDERQQELANIADEALKFQPTGYTLDTAQVKTKTPFLMRGTLREYQLVGLDWLVTLYEKNLNGILADEMGLGKTIQTISLLAHLACEEQIWGPHLIVVPTSVILNWEMEIKKWCPALKILTYFGSQKDRAEKRKGWMKPNSFHVCITSYKTVTQDIRSFKKKAWQYLILDEAQNIKNWKSQRWQALLNVRARRRLLLTGTPLQNSLMELWSLMHFLMPAIFASHDDFKDWFSNPLTGMMEGSVEFNAPLVQRLHKVLRPFILRRLKSEVEKQLPAKTEHVVKCSLSKRQRYLYDDFMSRRSTRDNLKSGNMLSVLNIVMQLRKCCNHPNLFEPRPVVSPLAMPQLEHTVPAPLLNVAETSDERARQRLPEGFRIADNVCGWTTGIRSGGRPLIEELENHEDSIQPPVVDGFRFKRPAVNKNTDGAAATSVMDVSAEELARAGFGHNEMFLVVGEDDDLESMLRGNGGAPVPVPVRFDQTQGRLVLDSSARNGVARVCRVVTGEDGSKTLRDVAGAAGVASTPEGSQIAAVPGPGGNAPVLETRAASGGDGAVGEPVAAATSVPTRQTRHTTVYRPQQAAPASAGAGTSKKDDVHPGLRSTTVMTPQSPQTTSSAGFHLMMEAGGSGTVESGPLSVTSLQLSPPLKRRKTARPPIVSGEWKECVPASTIALMEEARAVRLRRAAERFSDHRPMVARELLSVLWKETRRKKERAAGDDSWKWDSENATDRVEAIERLSEQTDRVLNRFCVYVEPALSECVRLQPHSAGLPAWFREEVCRRESTARLMLQDAPASVDSVMLSRRLQFPELRLIEYDCGKLQVLANLLRELFLYKHRCLIFTQMSRMLDVLQAFLSYHGYQYFRLDGTTGIEQRQAMMERFNADPRIFCFILSTRSGGVGVNLTGADTVIFYDSDWNPTMDAQAQDRCHRIGQTRNVSIYRLISEKTIEENILKKAMQKRRLGEMAIDEAGFTPDFFKQSDNIRDLFDGEVDATEIAAPTDAPRNQKELDKAMARLEDDQDVAAAKRVTAEATADKAEFDERTGLAGIDTDVDNKYLELIQQLRPIERYAINFLEAEYKPNFEEEVKEAEAMITSKKEEWVRAHEKAMDEDEMEGGDDDLYPGGSLLDEVRKGSKKGPSASASRRKSVALPVRQSTRQVPKKTSPRKSVSPNKRTPAQSAAVRVLKKAVAGERGRGRPRKVKEESEEPQSDVNTPPPIKRGRGRPRKDSRPCTPQSPAPVAELVSHHAHIPRRSGGEDARRTPSTSMPVPSPARPVMRLVSRGTPQSVPAPHSHHQPMRHHMQMPVRARPVGPPRLQSPVTSPQRGLLPVRVIRPGQPPQPQQPQQPVRVLMSPPGQSKKIVRIVRPVGQGGNATASGQRPVQNGSPGNPARFIRMPDGQLRRVVVVQRATRPSLGEYDRPRVSYRRTSSSTTDNGGEAEPGPSSQ